MSYDTVDEYYEELAKAMPLNAAEYLRRMPKSTGVGDTTQVGDRAKAAMNGHNSPGAKSLVAADALREGVLKPKKGLKKLKKSYDTADEYMAEIEEIKKGKLLQAVDERGAAAANPDSKLQQAMYNPKKGAKMGAVAGTVYGAGVGAVLHGGVRGAAAGAVGGAAGGATGAAVGAKINQKLYPKTAAKFKKPPTT